MSNSIIEEKLFRKVDFSSTGLAKNDYENCTFVNCVFSNTDLSNISFSGCEFNGCDLSMAVMTKSTLRNIAFKECKLLGLHFEHCNGFLFSADFEDCTLPSLLFLQVELKEDTLQKLQSSGSRFCRMRFDQLNI